METVGGIITVGESNAGKGTCGSTTAERRTAVSPASVVEVEAPSRNVGSLWEDDLDEFALISSRVVIVELVDEGALPDTFDVASTVRQEQ